MIDPEEMVPVPADEQPPRVPSRLRRFFLRHLPLAAATAAILLLSAAAGLYFWASSSAFEELVRGRIVQRLETATGGRVEIASFHWSLRNLEADANGLILHGLETPSETPFARVERLRVRVSVLGFLSPRILLRDLDIYRPGFHLIVYADGSTNQPQPRKPRKPGKPALDTLFDLQAGHISIDQGELDFENRASAFDFQNRIMPIDVDAADVSMRVAYVPAQSGNPESYNVQVGATHLNFFRGDARTQAMAAHGRVEAALDFTRNAAYLRSLRLSSGDHELLVSGTLQNFAHPRWETKITGDLDMRLLEPVTGYPFAPQGIARLDLSGAGQAGQFRADGTLHVDGGSYIGTGVVATGVGLDARFHADPEQLLVTSIVARPRQGGQIEGEVSLHHWLLPLPGAAVIEPVGRASVRAAGGKSKAPAPPKHPQPTTIPVIGKVTATLRNVSLDALLGMVDQPPFQLLGLESRINGPAIATWENGDVRTLAVSASLALSPSGQAVAGETPSSGVVEGTYTQRDGAVDLRQLQLRTPLSQIDVHGHLGAYPLTTPSALAVSFRSRNLWEFDTVLRDLGVTRSGKQGVAALPVTLGGEAAFQGSWSGSLADPHLAGNLKATQVALELPLKDTAGKPRSVHFDSVDAMGSYSSARIDVSRAQFNQGQAAIAVNGSLAAAAPSPTATGPALAPSFNSNSQLNLHLRAAKAGMEDLYPLIGQNLPITGSLNAQFDGAGPVRALAGSGWIELDGGTVFGEPVSRIRVQGSVAKQQIKLTSATLNEEAGKIQLNGTYDLKSSSFQLDARSTGFDLARIEWLHRHSLALAGKLDFSVVGSGTFDDPRLEAHANIAGLALSGESLGGLDFVARTANRVVTYDMSTRLEAAELSLHGETALSGENATKAKLEFSRFNIGALLRQTHIQGLNGESALAGTVTVEGPLARGEQLRGEARLQELEVTVAGVRLSSEGGIHASLADGRIHLDPLHVTGEQTDLHAQGNLSLKDKQQLDFAASGAINLKVAQTVDPDLTASGNTTFELEAHGPLQNPGLRGAINFRDAAISLEDLPNGLSQLNGTLEFNQNRLEVKSLTAMSGGGLLSLGGYLAYQNGLFTDLTATGKGIRIRYPQGVSSLADATMRLQGPRNNMLLSGNVLITRFTMSPDLDIAALANQAGKVATVASPDAPSNRVRLDVHVVSSPQLNFQNAYAKLAGDVDLRLRGTIASPSLLGRVSITEGSAMIAGTRYELQRGDISFTNPVRIQPTIDLNATARVDVYDITLGLHGTLEKPTVTYRSDPPLPEADVVALLALGRTENQQRIYTQQQIQSGAGANPTTDALLGGALNATVSSRVQKLFGAGSVKVDPNYLGALGNSTSRIIVEEQLGPNVTLTYATNVNTTAQQLIQAEVAINRHVSLQVARDESGVFSMVIKATRRYK